MIRLKFCALSILIGTQLLLLCILGACVSSPVDLPPYMEQTEPGGIGIQKQPTLTPHLMQSPAPATEVPPFPSADPLVLETVVVQLIPQIISVTTVVDDPVYMVFEGYNQSMTAFLYPEEEIRGLITEQAKPVRLLGFANKGCEIIASEFDRRVVSINLQGELQHEVLSPDWYSDDGWPWPLSISSQGDWMSYIVGSGSQSYAYWERQELETIRLVDGKSYALTQGGGAWDAAWSPVGEWIAFSEDDAEQHNQVYVARPDGTERRQLSYFVDNQYKAISIKWSPDGKKLAIHRYNFEEYTSHLAIISIDDDQRVVEVSKDIALPLSNYWWEDEERLVLHLEPKNTDLRGAGSELNWLQVSSGMVVERLQDSDTPDGSIITAGPFRSSTSAILSEGAVYLYDAAKRSFALLFELGEFEYYSDWFFSPPDFDGVEFCK